MRRGIILILTVALLPACASDDQPPPFEPQMAAVKAPVFRVIRYDSVDRKGAYVYPTSYSNGGFSWEEANAIAQDMKYRGRRGHLADFGSLEEERDVVAALAFPRGDGCWFGLVQDPTATTVDGGWRWQMSGAAAYANWYPGYPRDDDRVERNDNSDADYAILRVEDLQEGDGYQPYWRDQGAGAHWPCAIVELDR